MAEMKRNFLKGKMNKDFDERLVPSGEYRDALNVEIVSSEGSNVGTVQTLRGNSQVDNVNFFSSALTVGSVEDEENNLFYSFIANTYDLSEHTNGGFIGNKCDTIWQYKQDESGNISEQKVVVNDMYTSQQIPNTFEYTNDGQAVTITGLSRIANSFRPSVVGGFPDEPTYFATGVRVGMRVQKIDVAGNDLWGSADIRVLSIADSGDGTMECTITPLVGIAEDRDDYDAADIAAGTVIKFSSDRILNFSTGTKETATTVASSGQVSFTPSLDGETTIITGINVLDDLLLWTDGRNEPKKINIKNGIAGSSRLAEHTRLWIPQREEKFLRGWLKEEHINVIKKTPSTSPKIEPLSTLRNGPTSSLVTKYVTYESPVAGPFALHGPGGDIFNVGKLHWLDSLIDNVAWQEGDKIKLVGQSSNTVVYFRLIAPINAGTDTIDKRLFRQITVPEAYDPNEVAELWSASLVVEEVDSLFKDKFIHFAYRYKYTDGEYSVISPYSTSAFIADGYQYSALTGFNDGMLNITRIVNVSNFITPSTPEDVVAVEILARDVNDDAQSVWTVGFISINDTAWANGGSISIDDNSFGGAIPTDQLLRDQDFVPITARAQEIVGNKIIYGNYTQNYDLNKVNVITEVVSASPYQGATQLSNNNITTAQSEPLIVNQGGVGSDLYNGPLRTDYEASDPQGNFTSTPGNYFYTAPQDGTYIIKASVNTLIYKAIRGKITTATNTTLNRAVVFRPGVTLRLYDVDAAAFLTDDEVTQLSGGPSSNEFVSNTPSGQVFTVDLSYPSDFEEVNFTWQVPLTANKKIQVRIVVDDYSSFTTFPPEGVLNSISTDLEYGTIGATFSWPSTSSYYATIKNATFNVVSSPEVEENIILAQGLKSVKSNKTYQTGIMYTDGNRQAVVQTDESSKVQTQVQDAISVNRIACTPINTPPVWATHYKYVVKEVENREYNLVMSESYSNNDDNFAWLVFNSSDVDKISEGDFLIMKKKHNSTEEVIDSKARFKVLSISDQIPTAANDTPIIASADGAVGRFFVKVDYNDQFQLYLGTDFDTLSTSTNGAVFTSERSPGRLYDSGIFYEASEAHPIRLTRENAQDYIPIGSTLQVDSASSISSSIISSIKSKIDGATVIGVRGANCFNRKQILEKSGTDAFCRIQVDRDLTNILNGGTFLSQVRLHIRVNRPDGTFVTVRLEKGLNNDDNLHVNPYTHSVYDFNDLRLSSSLDFYNCIAFGNGVESDTIREDFGADSVHVYAPIGKISGFKASLENEDYKKEFKGNFLIHSQGYNEQNGINRLNEFLIGQSIERQIDENYGSVQKLFLRNTNLIIFCQSRVLRLLSGKTEFFKADGTADIIAANRVLGSELVYGGGEYGISNNPESFAINEQRIYFTDTTRGAVLRLSNDGITVISDYGMRDYFYDNLKDVRAAIGSYDGRKDEYNLTLHQVVHPYFAKNVNTVTFSEPANGWSCFKSFVPDYALTMNNLYYTFKAGRLWLHHVESVNRNTFYNVQTSSTVSPVFNDSPELVKSWRAMSYEGSEAKTTTSNGWYVESINTNSQAGKIDYFVNKEDKFFNSIQGTETVFVNFADGGATGTAANNIDTREFSVQGVGGLSGNPTVVGTTPELGYSITVDIPDTDFYTSPGFQYLNQTTTPSGLLGTFTISPKPGYSISASDFTDIDITEYLITPLSSITFSDVGTANTPSNSVLVTINSISDTLTTDLSITISDFNQIELEQANTLIRMRLRFNVDNTTAPTGVSVENVTISEVSPLVNSTLSIDQSDLVLYSISGTIPENAFTLLCNVQVALSSVDGYFYSALPEPILTSDEPNNEGIEFQTQVWGENIITNENGLPTAISYNVSFNPNAIYGINGNIYSSANYELSFDNQQVLRSSVTLNSDTIVRPNTAATYVIPINTINGIPTAVEAESWITIDLISVDSITITLLENIGASRSGDITITPANQTGENTVTLTVVQQSGSYIEIQQ